MRPRAEVLGVRASTNTRVVDGQGPANNTICRPPESKAVPRERRAGSEGNELGLRDTHIALRGAFGRAALRRPTQLCRGLCGHRVRPVPGSLGRGQPQATSAPPGRIQRSLAIPGPAPLSRNRPPTRGAVLRASDTLDAASGRRSVSTAERGQTGKQQGKEIEPLARRQPRRETEQKGTSGCQGPRVAQGRVAGHRRGLWHHSG